MNFRAEMETACKTAMEAMKAEGMQFDDRAFRAAFYAGAVVGNSIMMELITNKQALLEKQGSAFCHFITNQANRRN